MLFQPGVREPILRGNWNKPHKSKHPRLRRLLIDDWECDARTLDFLKSFPSLRELRVFSYDLEDIAGVHHLKHLRELQISRVSPKHLRLDLSRFKNLRSLSLIWSHHVVHLETLTELRSLSLDHIYGIKHLDLSPHPKLCQLDIGPAKGVETVSLEGLKHLRELTLAVMPRLTSITGKHFHHTVTELDIRGSHAIPAKTLASFTNLKRVLIGMSSSLTPAAFPKCKPKITRFPV